MDEKLKESSFLSILGSDSGLTLVNTDALVRKNEQQQLQLKRKNLQIEELEEKVENLQDVVLKYKNLLKELQQSNKQPITTWTKNLIEENKLLRERIGLVEVAKEQIEGEYSALEDYLDEKLKELDTLKERLEQSETSLKEVTLQRNEEDGSSLVRDLVDENEKLKKEVRLTSIENEELASECFILAEGIKAQEKQVTILEDRINELEVEQEKEGDFVEEDKTEKSEDDPESEEFKGVFEDGPAELNVLDNCEVWANEDQSNRKDKINDVEYSQPADDTQDLVNQNEILAKKVRLTSIENEELANECLVLAEGIKAQAQKIIILEDRIKELEADKQHGLTSRGDDNASEEETQLSKDDEECGERMNFLDESSTQMNGIDQREIQGYDGQPCQSDSDEEIDSFEQVTMEHYDITDSESFVQRKQLNEDGKLSEEEDSGEIIHELEVPLLSGKILPGRMTNIDVYMCQLEELKSLRNFVVQLSGFVELDLDIDFHEDDLLFKKTKILIDVEKNMEKMKEENREIKKEKAELKDLVEFLEVERQFTIEELDESKMKIKELEVNLKRAFEESDGKVMELEENLKESVQKNVDLENQVNFLKDCCEKQDSCLGNNNIKIERLMQKYTELGKCAKLEQRRRKTLGKKLNCVKGQLRAYKMKVFATGKYIYALTGKSLEQEIQIKDLQIDLKMLEDERIGFEKSYKKELADNLLFLDKMERYSEQKNMNNILQAALSRRNMEIEVAMQKGEEALKELDEVCNVNTELEGKFNAAMVKNEEIQKQFDEEVIRHESSKVKLELIESERKTVESSLNTEIQGLLAEKELLKEKHDIVCENLKGEIRIRLVCERKLRELTSEKEEIKVSLAEQVTKNIESEEIILTLQKMVEDRPKPKRSRLRRFFRRGSS